LYAFEDPKVARALLMLPYAIWKEVKAKKTLTKADARLMTAAVAIEMFLVSLARIQNVVDIDLEKSFWPKKPTASTGVHLCFAAEKVKNKVDLRFAMRLPTLRLLYWHANTCRPLLIKKPTSLLFLRDDGSHMDTQAIRFLVKK